MLGIALTLLSPVASGLYLSTQMPRGFNFKDMPTLKAPALCGFSRNPHSLCQELQLPSEEQLAAKPEHFSNIPLEMALGKPGMTGQVIYAESTPLSPPPDGHQIEPKSRPFWDGEGCQGEF